MSREGTFHSVSGKISGPSFTHHNPPSISSLQRQLQEEAEGEQVSAFAFAQVRPLQLFLAPHSFTSCVLTPPPRPAHRLIMGLGWVEPECSPRS